MSNPDHTKFTRFNQFQAIRKTNPNLYHSSAFQMAMHDLAEKYGAAFFETPASSDPAPVSAPSALATGIAGLDRSEKIDALRAARDAAQRQIEAIEQGDSDNANA